MKGVQVHALLFVILCIFSVARAQLGGSAINAPQYDKKALDKFFTAFPKANRTAFLSLPMELLMQSGPYVEPVSKLGACPPIAAPAPTNNVNALKPGHIKVVMAMGDSITAAMSAKDTSLFSLKEYRGIAFSIGGDSGVTTLPNILELYSPDLVGASTGIGERDRTGTGFNAAVSGAINIDMLDQAQWLVSQLLSSPNIDFQNDWKVLTLWIGSNNLCDVCADEDDNDADNFVQYVTEALEYIYVNVPRVFVNLVVNLDITQLADIDGGACSLIHYFACNCVSGSSDREDVLHSNIEYQVKAYSIAQTFASRNNPNFTVVVQPFLEQTTITERSELSAADCFHPAALSHGVAAVGLWNNMISPAAQKKLAWNLDDTPICATEDTLLYTY